MQGIVTNIQRFSIHDGPGIRTTVFFKGCNLACYWCHNPETLNPKPELQLFMDRCIGCGACFGACPQGAHLFDPDSGKRLFLRDRCLACGQCASTCYAEALVLVGETKTVDEVLANSPVQVEQYKGGKKTVIGFFVGQVMKATRGQADPKAVNQLLRRKLG